MELSEKELRERAEYRRLVDEEFERKRKTGFKDAAEALKAFRDLFESDEERKSSWRGSGPTVSTR